jgi:hypothetical protein
MRPNPVHLGAVPRAVVGRRARHDALSPGLPPQGGKAAARHFRQVQEAAKLVPELPEPGHHVHCLMTGFYDLCQVITDICRRTRPRALRIATLCWSKKNAADLAGMMEERKADPLPLTLVVSDFFRTHNKELVRETREALAEFGPVRIIPTRSHAKVTAFDLGPGDGLVMEGSANLRTNRNQEQIIVIRDRAAHDWHAAWIDGLTEGK